MTKVTDCDISRVSSEKSLRVTLSLKMKQMIQSRKISITTIFSGACSAISAENRIGTHVYPVSQQSFLLISVSM